MSRSAAIAAAVTAVLAAALCASAAADQGDRHAESWQRSYVDPRRPKAIKLAYETSPSYTLDHVSVYFHDDRVAFTIWLRPPEDGALVTSAVVRCTLVRMGEPLRGRRRIDGKTHRHPSQEGQDPLMQSFSLRRAHCPRAKVRRHHLEQPGDAAR